MSLSISISHYLVLVLVFVVGRGIVPGVMDRQDPKISKVSTLVYFLYEVAVEQAFENFKTGF